MNPSSSVPALEASGVHKTYPLSGKPVVVLRGASISVAPGEHVAIVGASGAGKSTLLHLLGGLDRPDRASEGSVRISGTDIYALSASRRSAFRAANLGFVFQSYHLLPEMDCVENVLLPALALPRHPPVSALRRRAEELLDAVGLGHRLRHKPLELSGGEQQRAAIARALMNNPPLLLADEPTGNLDEALGIQVLDLLFSLGASRSIVLVTHSPAIAARCTRTLNLKDGLLV